MFLPNFSLYAMNITGKTDWLQAKHLFATALEPQSQVENHSLGESRKVHKYLIIEMNQLRLVSDICWHVGLSNNAY